MELATANIVIILRVIISAYGLFLKRGDPLNLPVAGISEVGTVLSACKQK